MSELSDKYSKNFSAAKKAEFNRRFRDDYDASMSEESNILRILMEMREQAMRNGGIMRKAYQEGTNIFKDFAEKAGEKFGEFTGISQIEDFPGAYSSATGPASDFRHQAASNLIAQKFGKGIPFTGPIGYTIGGGAAFGLGTIKEIGDLALGIYDKNTTTKEAFEQALEDTISNFKGSFAPPGTTTEDFYDEIIKSNPNFNPNFPPIFQIPRFEIDRLKKIKEIRERNLAAEQAQAINESKTRSMAIENRARGEGGFQSDFAQDRDFMGGKGTAAEMGSFAKGGLAKMLGE